MKHAQSFVLYDGPRLDHLTYQRWFGEDVFRLVLMTEGESEEVEAWNEQLRVAELL